MTGKRGRRRRKLLDDLKERTGYSDLKEETLDRTMWRAGFGRGFGPVVRQTAKSMNDLYTWGTETYRPENQCSNMVSTKVTWCPQKFHENPSSASKLVDERKRQSRRY